MPNYQGVWSLSAHLQAIADTNWPMPPGIPTSVSATAGDAQASVAFTAPTFAGVPGTITGFKVTSSAGQTATGSSSPITVTSLSNGTAYTFTVQAQNATGFSGASSASSSITPVAIPRALFAGGTTSGDAQTNTISYLDLDSTGNATDFGDLSSSRDMGPSGMASSTRAVFSGGGRVDYGVNTIEYATFSSTGNTTDFGDSTAYQAYPSALSSSTRGVSSGGYNKGSGGGQGTNDYSNIIEYITIASTGNATDFGDFWL